MNSECRIAYDKTNRLIRERKHRLGETIQPEIQNLDSGILLQYFENWNGYSEIYDDNSVYVGLKKHIDNFDDEDIEEIYMAYGERDTIKGYVPEFDKLFIMLDGDANFELVETGEIFHLKPFTSKIFKGGEKLNIYGNSDINYFVIVKFKSPLI